jgi:hypothetical protein
MELTGNMGETAIQDVILTYPEIGDILACYDIGCVTCKVGICLLKDVVSIHGLSWEEEARIKREINEHLAKKRRMRHGKSGMRLPRQLGKGN